ncbi:BLOC-1-related complex subunit 8 isoform X3 [Erinaceus europaeus]|nr:BLOC-1-related complex subunit 8 isoform X3 [Erinaceus europaeus]
MQRWEEQSQGAIYTVEYACSAVKSLVDSGVHFRSVEGLLRQAISIRDHMNAAQGHSPQDQPSPPRPDPGEPAGAPDQDPRTDATLRPASQASCP